MAHSFAALYCHIIFSTKNREQLIAREFQPRLFAYIGGVLRDERMALLAVGGMPDHVHLLVSLARESSVADAVRLIKANSSGWVHKTFPDLQDFAWQSGYGAFSVSASAMPAVKRYLDRQEEHHRTQSFEEEFVSFLRKHGIEYDERYLCD
jgi:REP element-mobilizing transposase RayT